jgi:S1-C subfamily serine protease
MRIAFSFAVVVSLAFCATADAADQIAKSVVKIHATKRKPDFARPWNKAAADETTGSGVIIEGNRILTNAHVVLYASQVFVQADQSTERVPAKVKVVAPGIDMAIIEVDKPSFFEGHPALPISKDMPSLKQSISVYGYPIGGEQVSVTQGIISRVEFTSIYYFVRGLRIQIDAAINPGNSGGPAVADGKVVGLVFSKITKGDNIGYLLAADEIRTFLKDIEDGKHDGKPQIWDHLLSTENEALRARLGLTKEAGMVVYKPFRSTDDYPLKKWDVITHVGGEPLDSQGNVKINDGLRLQFQYLVAKQAKDGRVKLTIIRDRKPMDVQVPVRADGDYVLSFLLGRYPRYFIHGPMIFMPAYQDVACYLPSSLVMYTRSPLLSLVMAHPSFEGEEIVTLGVGLLPHKTSKGYTVSPFSVVTHVNGTAVRNMRHLVTLLRDAKGEFLTIDVAGDCPPLVFRREEVLKATEDILSDEGVRKQYSDDLEDVWHPKTAS